MAPTCEPLQHCSLDYNVWIGTLETTRLFYLPARQLSFRCVKGNTLKIEGGFQKFFDPKVYLGGLCPDDHTFKIGTGTIPKSLAAKIFVIIQDNKYRLYDLPNERNKVLAPIVQEFENFAKQNNLDF